MPGETSPLNVLSPDRLWALRDVTFELLIKVLLFQLLFESCDNVIKVFIT